MSPPRIPEPDRVLHTHDIDVRITDLNYGNHLGHDTLVSLLHDARAAWLRAHGLEEGDVDGKGVILVELAVSYRAQVRQGQTLRIEIGPGAVGSRGFEILHRVRDRDTGELVALARTGLLVFDYGAGRVAPIGPRLAALLAAPGS